MFFASVLNLKDSRYDCFFGAHCFPEFRPKPVLLPESSCFPFGAKSSLSRSLHSI